MIPSERIEYIKEIARRLSPDEWRDIDLVLRQFGLPTPPWVGKRYDYVVGAIEEADDASLLALAEHLGYAETFLQASDPEFWLPDHFRLFLSHIAKFKAAASDLQNALRKYGISAFVAHEDIEPTKEWQDEIELALNTMDALAALLHPGFKESNWADQEVGIAVGRGVLIVPVRFGLDPYGFIGKYQAIQGAEKKFSFLAEEVCRIFLGNLKTKSRMADAIVARFADADSFADAKEKISLVESCAPLNSAQRRTLEKALEENSQIRHAFGVPSRVTSLLK